MECYQIIPWLSISSGISLLLAWALHKAYQMILSVKKQLSTKELLLKQTQEELAQKNKNLKKYIELNAESEQFVAIAAHDIKSPLRSIGGFTSILKRRFYSLGDENTRSYFDMIEQSTKRLGLLTDDYLLQSSKADTQGLNLERVLLTDVLREVREDLNFCISQSRGQVIGSNCDIRLYADRIKLKQVLQNLISNALKFRDAGRNPLVEIHAWENASHICISVRDNGIGIPEKHFKRVFKKFARIHEKECEGTGLGLSICEKYIKKHKGNIRIERNNDHGVTFTFSVSKSLCEAQHIASSVQVRKAHVLVA